MNTGTGIDIRKVKTGTLILALTKHSLYRIAKCEKDNEVMVQGGKHLMHPKAGRLTGSTFGGTSIKLGWIGYNMNMEFFIPEMHGKVTTSPVIAVRIIGDGWEYDMDWK